MKANWLKAYFQEQQRARPVNQEQVRAGRVLLALAFVLLGSIGCATTNLSDVVTGPNFVPQNVHRLNRHLPPTVRRLAVLPMTGAQSTAKSDAGVEMLCPVLLDEVSKTKKFEVIAVPAEILRKWTGKSTWNAEDALPPNFFRLLENQLGCDAVLFSRLSLFHPYPPLAIGWNLKLVQVEEAKLLWAADEVVDATDRSVVAGARRYQKAQEQLSACLADSRSILVSPKRFGQYAASAILASLPER